MVVETLEDVAGIMMSTDCGLLVPLALKMDMILM